MLLLNSNHGTKGQILLLGARNECGHFINMGGSILTNTVRKSAQHLIFKFGNEYGCSLAQYQQSISVGTRTENQGAGATVDV